MSQVEITPQAVMAALSQVQDPEMDRDLVSMNRIRDLKVDGGDIRFSIQLPTPAYPRRDLIEQNAYAAVAALPGVQSVSVTMDVRVTGDGRERRLMQQPVKNAIAIASGKGGVGKSTVAVNIAVALAQSGARVGLLDADIYGPNVPTMMGVTELPPQQVDKLVPAEAYGVQLMSIGFLVKPEQPLIWRGPMLHKAIEQFLTDVAWGELDYLIIDLPPGTGDAVLSISQTLALTGGVIVTLPQQVSLDDALRGLEMFRQLEVDVLGVIENMSYLELPDGSRVDVFGSGGGQRLADQTGVAFIGAIPMDPAVRAGGDAGRPVVLTAPDSPVAQALRNAAESIAVKASKVALEEPSDLRINLIG